MTKRTLLKKKSAYKGTKKRKQRRLKRYTNKRNQRRKTRRKGGMFGKCIRCREKQPDKQTPQVPPPPPPRASLPPPPQQPAAVEEEEEEVFDGPPISNVDEAITIWNELYNKYHRKYNTWKKMSKPDKQKIVQAMNFLNTKAESGDVQAQLMLAEMYVNGQHHEGGGVVLSENEKNEAIKWYDKAALKGDAEAQYRFGQQIEYNKFNSIGPSKSVNLYIMAADQGHVMAQYTLGRNYEYGIERPNYSDPGVPINSEQARYWYAKAADHEVSNLTEPEKDAVEMAKEGAKRTEVGKAKPQFEDYESDEDGYDDRNEPTAEESDYQKGWKPDDY